MTQSICSSVKEGHQLLIKDLLDSHDENNEKFENLLKRFSEGQNHIRRMQMEAQDLNVPKVSKR